MRSLWNRLFLEERSSISLSFFRIVVALTTGSHVIPSLFNLEDNYFATAYKSFNLHFFPKDFVLFVQKSPDELVVFFVVCFFVFWFFFLIGLFSQLSCILMTLCCYYFYALNSFHVGTLSWDILLVTLFLMCVTSYHGDYFSVDALRKNNPQAYRTLRPIFLQRMLQMQVAFTFFYTGLYKITAQGNWLNDNPIYYLMNYPPAGVTKYFLLRDFFMDKPNLCYILGVTIIICEILLPVFLFWRKTRTSAIYLGSIFLISLLLTLDVPATFGYMFPFQLMLFIHSDKIIGWIEQKRAYNEANPHQSQLVYDGSCQICRESVQKLLVMDLFSTLKLVNFQSCDSIKALHSDLDRDKVLKQIYLIEPNGALYGGYSVFQRLCLTMPMLYPLVPVFYFPGAGLVGPVVYRIVAKNRYLLKFRKTCDSDACHH